jgi:O-antigen ligase
MGIVASLSRGGFVGLVVVILYFIAMGRNRARNLAVTLIGAAVFFLAIPSNYKSELKSIQHTEEGTSEARLFLWRAAFNMFLDNPIFGVGAGNSNWNVGKYQPPASVTGMFSDPIYSERDWTMASIHSANFQLLSEQGIVGTAVFIAILVGHFKAVHAVRRRVRRDPRASRSLRRDTDLYAVGLGGAMAGYLASGSFLSVLYYAYPWYFSAFAVALSRAVNEELQRGSPRPRDAKADQSVLPVAFGSSHSS